jgi:hypothetical protein
MAAFDYNFYVTGDCYNTNSGIISVSLSGGVEPYTIDFVTPSLGTGSTKTGLSAGQYIIRANDALGDVNNEFYINVIVSSGGCLNVTSVSATTCGLDNGSISLSATSTAYPITLKLYSGTTLIQTGITSNGELELTSIPSGIYNAYYEDYGGCSGYSESIIILPSTPVDYGFYVVNNTNCYGNVGKVQITGLTGNPPFTYLWDNGSTGTTITGLTADTYSVTVTDSTGCASTKIATVNNANPLEIVSLQTTNPTCFSGDGTVRIIITGGTGPFYYSGSNGSTLISYSTDVVFSGFSPGTTIFKVTDATLCSTSSEVYLQDSGGFSVVGIQTTNSTCSISGGTIVVNVIGNTPFTYTLIKPDSSTEQFIQNLTQQTFSNLDGGTYTVVISNQSGCEYSQEVTIFTSDKFSLSASTTGTTCGLDNGACSVNVGTGYTGVLDMILTKNNVAVTQYIDIIQSAVTFNGLTSGVYELQVRDQDNCSVYTSFSIADSEVLDFGLSTTNCGPNNNSGTIVTTIFSGVPPFTYQWSENLPSFSGPNPTGLSGGTYTLTVTDSSGCTLTRSIVVPCTPTVSGYQVIPIVSSGFTTTYNNKRDFESMLNEGFYDLTSGNTNCVLSNAIYTATVEISGNTYTENFYTGTTLSDVPSESLWVDTIENILSGITGVGSYTVNPITNVIEIKSECDGTTDQLSDSEFISGLIIDYDIYCET